ncbi:MAG: SpoIIE family protein phosphatase [bacterium]
MNPKLHKCLEKHKDIIAALSAESLRQVLILYNCKGEILWYNWVLPAATAYSEKEMVKFDIFDLLMPPPGTTSNEQKERILSGDICNLYFHLKTNTNTKNTYNEQLSYESRYEPFGIFGLGSKLKIENDKILLLTRMIYYHVDKTARADPLRCFIRVDQNWRIFSYSMSFNNLIQPYKGKIAGKQLKHFLVKKDWDRMQSHRNDTLKLLRGIRDNTKGHWIKRYSCNFSKQSIIKNFWFDTNNKWLIRNNYLSYKKTTNLAFCTCKKTIDQYYKDIKLKINANGLMDGLGLFICGQPGSMDTSANTPDNSGYLINTIHNKIRLRRSTKTISAVNYHVPGIPSCFELIFEKTGGLFSLFLNGKPIAEFHDLNPIFEKDLKYCGFIARFPIKILKFEVFSRKSMLLQKHIPEQSSEIRFKNKPHRIFRINSSQSDSYRLKNYNEFVLDDITEIKNYQKRLEKSEKEKNRYIDKLVKSENEKKQYILKIDREMEEARKIQQSLLPQNLPEIRGIETASRFIPTGKVGGDMFDIIQMENNRLGILIFDVCGHGLAAAFITSMAKMAFNNNISRFDSPAEVMTAANKELSNNINTEHFVAAFYGILNLGNMDFTYCSGGHIPPLHFSSAENSITSLKIGSVPLGMFPAANYKLSNAKLYKGDYMVFYTDGLNETMNSGSEQFGHNRLINTIKNCIPGDAETILTGIEKERRFFAANRPNEDDITIIVMGVK